MTSSEKTLAIVLRVVEFSETSVVVTLFTQQFGKVSALAKGARRPKGPFESALDLLSLVRIVFLHKSSESLDLLTEAKLERRFRSASRDLGRLYAGYYVAELLHELTDRGDPHPALFEAADEALQSIDAGVPLPTVVLRMELSALQEVGHMPTLDRCAACSDAIRPTPDRVAFGMMAGGLLCDKCRHGQRQVVSVSHEALEVLRILSESVPSTWKSMEVPLAVRGELRGVMGNYLSHLLGHRPRMHELLGYLAK